MSHKKDGIQSVKRGVKKANAGHQNSKYANQSSPYSSRGTSPARSLRKSRSAEERFGFNDKPPSSRGSGNQSEEEEEEETPGEYEGNDGPATDEDSMRIEKAPEVGMQQEEISEKPKQRFIVETITMTTVTERRIVREASDSNGEEGSGDGKRNGILKGGKFWRNSTEKPPGKTVNYNETVNYKDNEEIEETEEETTTFGEAYREDRPELAEDEKAFQEEAADEKKPEDVASPESTELTLTFKLGQHLLLANSLKSNSAMRQLFPSPRFLSPPPLEDGDGAETNKPIPPKQFLVTAESLRLFEEAKKSKILGNMNSEEPGQSFIAIMPPMSKNEEEAQNNRLHKTIERNTLRRSLIKYSYEFRNKRLSEKKKNENSLEERIRQLTCGIDDEEEQQEEKKDGEVAIPPRSSPQGEESTEGTPAQADSKNPRRMDTPSPSSNSSSSGSSTYKKLTDLFSRKTNPPPVLEDINRNIKTDAVQCDLVLNSQNAANSCPQSHRNPLFAARNLLPRMSLTSDAKKHAAPPGEGDRCQQSGEEYSLQDIDEGLRDSDQKKLGVQPDVIAETPQNETPNDELALFVQQDAGRIEKLKKRYSAAEDKSDDDDDYGFNKRPLVKGIKQKFNAAEPGHQVQPSQSSVPCNPKPTTTTATTTTIHTTWPYYSQENVDPKTRAAYPPRPEDGNQYAVYGTPQEYRGYAEMAGNYVEYQAVGQQRINYVNQGQQNVYASTNTFYRCHPVRFGGGGYSELSNYQFRHPPHSPPPLRRVIPPSQATPVSSEDGRARTVDGRVLPNRNAETYGYAMPTSDGCVRPKIGLPDAGPKVIPQSSDGVMKNPESAFHRRTVPNVQHNPCLQMKFSPLNYHQGAVPTASIRFSASCSPHPVVDESNVIIEPHYSTFPHPPNQNTVGVIRVGQGQQMIRVPVPYSTGTPVQVHLMAGRLGRCDSPQRPSSPQGAAKAPVQPYNQYLIAKGTQTAQVQSFAGPAKPAADGAPQGEALKTVDFEKQGKAIAEELQSRQKLALSRSLSQETNYQARLPQSTTAPGNLMAHQERGVPEGAASSSVQDSQPPNPEAAAPGNTIYYTMNV